MFIYKQSTGLLSGNGLQFTGYSGFKEGKNNPSLQDRPSVGPIPQGRWIIQGPPFDTSTHGPFVMRLLPEEGTNTFGRSGFLIHGDSIIHPGMASLGCIILPRTIREAVWHSEDRDLIVIE